MVGITVHKDENGVLREYREEKRRANVGELIKIVDAKGNIDYENGDIFVVTCTSMSSVDFIDRVGDPNCAKHDEYVVLVPTNIIHYEGKRYREVKRRAKYGDLVLIVRGYDTTPFTKDDVGKIVKVTREKGETCGGMIKEHCVIGGRGALYHDQYVALEPLDDASPSPPADDDRIAVLEKTVDDLQKRVAALEDSFNSWQNDDTPRLKLDLSRLDGFGEKAKELVDKISELKFKLRKPTRDEIIERAKRDVEELQARMCNENVNNEGNKWFRHYQTKVEFKVNREKRTVVALLRTYFGSEVVERGIAKAHPEDCFNVTLGKCIALRRALGLDVPDEYINAPQPEYKVGDKVNVCYRDERIAGTITYIYECDDKACLYRVKFDNGHWDVFTYNELSDDVDDSKSENEPTVTFNKEKALRLLACLLHSIYPVESDSPGYDRRKLIDMSHELMWDIANVFGYDLNKGYINPTTLEYVRYND
jgi:hypothetical protein